MLDSSCPFFLNFSYNLGNVSPMLLNIMFLAEQKTCMQYRVSLLDVSCVASLSEVEKQESFEINDSKLKRFEKLTTQTEQPSPVEIMNV